MTRFPRLWIAAASGSRLRKRQTVALDAHSFSSLPTAIERRLPGGARRLRVLLIDDHPAIRAGLAVVLDVDPGITAVAAAASARDGLLQAGRLELDVVVVDGYLPREDGLWLVPRNNGVNA